MYLVNGDGANLATNPTTAGYCFGAPYALNLGATDFLAASMCPKPYGPPPLWCSSVHPQLRSPIPLSSMNHTSRKSKVVTSSFKYQSTLTRHKIQAPVLISCAEDDFAFPVEARHRAESILTKNKSQFHIQVFSGVSHGFASKGDPEDPAACECRLNFILCMI